MCRPISVDPLAFHQFQMGVDSVRVKFDRTKKDQEGAKTSWKNIFDNTNNPAVSAFLSMGCYLALMDAKFVVGDNIFLNKKATDGSASHRYCTQLMKIVRKPELENEVKEYMRYDRLSVYGFRKGSAVSCTSDATDGPSIVSVLNRGEWSGGKVFDTYFQWANAGDEYCGRCVRGVSPNDDDFSMLPPHWNVEGSAMSNEHINKAMRMCFGNVLKEHSSSMQGPLLLFLASMVYHSTWCQGHRILSQIPLFTEKLLLADLKKIVTLDKSPSMPGPTGIPAFVRNNELAKRNFSGIQEIIEMLKTLLPDVAKAIESSIEKRQVESGVMTIKVLEDRLFELKNDTVKELKIAFNTSSRIGTSLVEACDNSTAVVGEDIAKEVGMGGKIVYFAFAFDGKFWHTPKDYSFCTKMVTAPCGWRLWLKGNSAYTISDGKKARAILPYRKIRPSRVQNAVARRKLIAGWRPIFMLMEKGLAEAKVQIPNDIESISEEFLESTYKTGMAHVKSRASYIWETQDVIVDAYSIATWSKMIGGGEVRKRGLESDKTLLHQDKRDGGRQTRRRYNKR